MDPLKIWEIIFFCAKVNKNVIFVASSYSLIQQMFFERLPYQGHGTGQNG